MNVLQLSPGSSPDSESTRASSDLIRGAFNTGAFGDVFASGMVGLTPPRLITGISVMISLFLGLIIAVTGSMLAAEARVRCRNLEVSVDRLCGKYPACQACEACQACCVDLEVMSGVVIPASELEWKFSRSSGPGGQHVNTSDSRVQLTWVAAQSSALSDEQRMRVVDRLTQGHGLGAVTVTVSEQRSQVRNREIARAALRKVVAAALAPAPALRRPTRPTRGSERRRSASKQQRSETKQQRRRPTSES